MIRRGEGARERGAACDGAGTRRRQRCRHTERTRRNQKQTYPSIISPAISIFAFSRLEHGRGRRGGGGRRG